MHKKNIKKVDHKFNKSFILLENNYSKIKKIFLILKKNNFYIIIKICIYNQFLIYLIF